MKRFFLSAFFAFLLLAALPAEGRTFVLAAGVSDYENPEIPDLKRPGKDAMSFAQVMKTQTPDVTTLTSRHATRENVLAGLTALCNRAQSGDRIVFYFSGHGSDGQIYLYDRPIYYSELSQLFESTDADEIVCFIDACFSGSIANDLKNTDKDIVFFLSSRPDEMSMEAADWVGAGYLTQALMKGIQGKADSDGNREVTVIELFKYIYADVQQRIREFNKLMVASGNEKNSQHPQLIAAKKSFDLVLAKW